MANIEIGGRLHSTATGNVVAGANEIYDDAKGKKQSVVNQETDAALDDRYTKSQTYNKTELNNMITTPNQKYVSVTATDQTTAVTDVLPATGAADTTYRVGNWDGTQYNDSVFSEYAWNGSAYIKLSTKLQVGEVYDISANHADTKYVDLAAALGTNGANVPAGVRKGGMSVKYVQTSDNKYVQYRLMAQTFSTDEADWQGVDVEPTAGSKNLVESGGVKMQTAIDVGENATVYKDKQLLVYSATLTDAVGWICVVVETKDNPEYYLFSGTGGFSSRLLTIRDKNNNNIEVYNTNATAEDVLEEIPYNSVAYFNFNTNCNYSIKKIVKEDNFNNIIDGYPFDSLYQGITVNNGTITERSDRVTTGVHASPSDKRIKIICNTDYQISVTYGDSIVDELQNSSGWTDEEFEIPTGKYFAVNVRKKDGANITPSDKNAIGLKYIYEIFSGVPIDSKKIVNGKTLSLYLKENVYRVLDVEGIGTLYTNKNFLSEDTGLDLTPHDAPGWCCIALNVMPGFKFYIKGTGGSNPRLYFCKKTWGSLSGIDLSSETATLDTAVTISDPDSARLYINFNVSVNDDIGFSILPVVDNVLNSIVPMSSAKVPSILNHDNAFDGIVIPMKEGYNFNCNTKQEGTDRTFHYAKIPVSFGDVVTIIGTGGSSPRLWCTFDSSMNIVRQSASNATESGLVLTIQTNEAWLVINDKTKSTSFYGKKPDISKDESETDHTDLGITNHVIQLPLVANSTYDLNDDNTITYNEGTVNGFYCVKQACTQGDIFFVSGTGGNKARLWMFLDSNDMVIAKSSAVVTEENLRLETPNNASFVIFNFNSITNPVHKAIKNATIEQRVSYLEEFGSEGIMEAVNEMGLAVEDMQDTVESNSASIDALEETVQQLTPASVNVDLTDNVVTDWLQQHSIAQNSDDFIAWYYNVPARDIRTTFYNYINSLATTKDLETNKLFLKQSDETLSHDASLAIDNTNHVAYVVCTTDSSGTGSDNPNTAPTTTRLYIVDISNDSNYNLLSFTDCMKKNTSYSDGEGGTITTDADRGVGCPNIYRTSDGKIHILTNAVLTDQADGAFRMIHITYNPSNSTFESYKKCSILINNNTVAFTGNAIGQALGITQNGSFINLNSSISYNPDDGYFYTGTGLQKAWKKGVIVRTQDFTNWEYCCIPNYTIASNNAYETAVAIRGEYMFTACRQTGGFYPGTYTEVTSPRTTLLVAKIRLSDYSVVENLYMPDCGARPCFFDNGNTLYLLHSTKNRVVGDVVRIDTDLLSKSEYLQQILDYVQYPDVKRISGNKYCFIATKNSGIYISCIRLFNISQAVIDEKFFINV